MSDLLLDEATEDLELINGDLSLTTGLDRTKQFLDQRLAAFQGEWFLDEDVGVPYYSEILRKNPDPVLVDGVLKSVILGTPGVIELQKFDITFNTITREFSLDFRCVTEDGPIDFNQALGGTG